MSLGSVIAPHDHDEQPRVLLVDDDEVNLLLTSIALRERGFSITEASSGEQAIHLLTEWLPDVVVLDLQIGSMGGMAVAMDLRLDATAGKPTDARILMLLDRRADLHLARRSAADAWLVKPLDPLALKRAVRDLLHPPAPATEAAPADEAAPAAEEEVATAG